MMGAGQPGVVDTNGHIGGGIAGLLWGFAFFPRDQEKASPLLEKAGRAMLVAYLGSLLVLFYTMRTFGENELTDMDDDF